MNNRIGDIDDAKLGRMVKELFSRIETEGGNLTFSRNQRRPYAIQPGVEDQALLPQDWTVQIVEHAYPTGVFATSALSNKHATLSHPDLIELLDRIAIATR